MNATASVVISVLAASAAAVGVTLSLQPADTSTDSLLVSQLQSSLLETQEANQQLAERLDALSKNLQPAALPATMQRTEAPTVSAEQVAAAVEAYLSTRGDLAGQGTNAGKAAEAGFDIDKDLESLLGSNYWDNSDMWKRAFKAGRMDEVLAEFEALATANPNDVKSQMDLANAYMAYMQMDSSKWQMSMKADEQFDKVLDIDENHWGARFTKAVSYTFWPPFLGKQKEAISNFETLIKQQESMPVEDSQAQTYLYLGNMLAERDPVRAREVWLQGMARHPNNEELRKRLGN